MEDLNKIKDRIAKLLAMAQDTSSPEEAAIAASRARKLMDKYQVEAWECEKKISESFTEKAATRTYAMVPEYLCWLASAVAKFNDCQAVYGFGLMTYKMEAKRNQNNGRAPKQFGKHIVFRGYESDVQMACSMFDMLLEAANNQCKAYLKPFNFKKYPMKEGTAFKAQFCNTIGNRLADITKERDELTMTSSSTALVLIKKTAVAQHFGEVKYAKSKYSIDYEDDSVFDAARAGHHAGKRQQLMNEIKGEESVKSEAKQIAG